MFSTSCDVSDEVFITNLHEAVSRSDFLRNQKLRYINGFAQQRQKDYRVRGVLHGRFSVNINNC